MPELKIPNLKKKSDRFFFKKKLFLRKNTKKRLLNESFIMISFSFFLIYLNYLIPNKISILNKFTNNINELINSLSVSMNYVYSICLAIYVVISIILVFILMLGAILRLSKVVRGKSKQTTFK